MAATIEADYYNGVGPTRASAEAGFKFNREDTISGTTPIPIPTATGTNFSYHKAFALYCSAGGGSTSLLNRKIYTNGAPSDANAKLWWTLFATDTYSQATAVASADSGADNSTPATGTYGQAWAAVPTTSGTATTWDAATVAATNTTKNGKYLVVCCGVASIFAAGAGSFALPDFKFQYDEQ